MDREVSAPVLAGAVIVVVLLLVGCWWVFLRTPSGTDPRLERKAAELKQRRQTVAPPTPR